MPLKFRLCPLNEIFIQYFSMSPQHAFRRIRVLIDDSLIRTFSQVNITTQCLNQQISDFKFTQFKLSLITIIIQCYFFIWQRLSCLWACLHLCQEQFIQNRKTFDPFVFSLVIQTQVDASSFLFTPSQISWGFTLRNTTQKDIKPLFLFQRYVLFSHMTPARDKMSWNIPSEVTDGWLILNVHVFVFVCFLQLLQNFLFLFFCHTSGAM